MRAQDHHLPSRSDRESVRHSRFELRHLRGDDAVLAANTLVRKRSMRIRQSASARACLSVKSRSATRCLLALSEAPLEDEDAPAEERL